MAIVMMMVRLMAVVMMVLMVMMVGTTYDKACYIDRAIMKKAKYMCAKICMLNIMFVTKLTKR